MSLDGCDFNDFLMRWRFLSIRINENGEKIVLFTPHQTGATVFFGNLSTECDEKGIYSELEKVESLWKYSSVRLKLGKGFAYAFVDFPTRHDALRAVKYFDGRSAFKSKYVSADIEAIEQKRTMGKHGNSEIVNKDDNRFSDLKTDYSGNNVNKATVYVGNLKDDITKKQIQQELATVDSNWETLPIRLNLRNGWSHAFVDFANLQDAQYLIHLWHNKVNSSLSNLRLRCEISKRQHV